MTGNVGPVVRDEDTATFFDGTARGEFLIRRPSGGGPALPPTAVRSAGSPDLVWEPADGTGRIVSWTVVHGRARDGTEPPRTVVGVVELSEGPWWWARIVDVDPAADLTGIPVRVAFARNGEHEAVPVFRPA